MPYVPADAQLITCESIIDYTFSNKLLGLEALNTAGQGNPLLYGGRTYADIPKNKVMAQYGDAIADFVVMGVWMRGVSSQSARFYNTGVSWDAVKQSLLSNTALHARGVERGIDKCVLLNPGAERISTEMVARTMEAIFGAVFQDGGIGGVTRVLGRLGLLGLLDVGRGDGEGLGVGGPVLAVKSVW